MAFKVAPLRARPAAFGGGVRNREHPARPGAAASGRPSTRRRHHGAVQVERQGQLAHDGLPALPRRATAAAAAQQEQQVAAAPPEATAFVDGDIQGDPRCVQLSASSSGRRAIAEGDKALGAYMALPSSQYSVLDGAKVERLGTDTFRVFVAPFTFFALEVAPVLTLQVHPREDGCEITMLACKLKGSGVVEAQNSNFSARMTNRVRWRPTEHAHESALESDVVVDVDLIVPRWFVLPKAATRSTGNAVIATILRAAVPRFLNQLESDYAAWAAGDERRAPVAAGELT